ncbi:response regulator [Salinispira pacifica]
MPPAARVLVIEDEILIAVEIEETLRSFGYEPCGIFGDAESALAHIEDTRPDIILMDINLAGSMDGTEAAALIVQRFGLRVVFVSAYNDRVTIERAKTAGPFGYVTKPFQPRELYTAVELALARHQLEESTRRHERLLAATFNVIGDSVVSLDSGGRIQLLNRAAEQLIGRAGGRFVSNRR